MRVVSARPKTTELTNVLKCQRFVNLHSSEAEAATPPINTLIRGIKRGVGSEINYIRVNFILTRAMNVYLASISKSRMPH
jgi:hypothetical protein